MNMKQKFIKKEQEETVEQITPADADKLLNKNIYDYGIDILEDRVLADFRDGFKPAQRRILWAARDLRAYPDSKTVKSARIVGDTMRKVSSPFVGLWFSCQSCQF